MRKSIQRQGPMLAALMAVLTLGGCAFDQTIADHSIAYNKAVAQSRDAQILLNILRARDRQPMHFTVIGSVTGQLVQTARSTFGFGIPFGGDAASAYTFSPEFSASQESKPLFTIIILDNDEKFVNAVLTPIEMTTVKLFLEQGWRKDFLIYLLVEKVEVSAGDHSPITFNEVLGAECEGIKNSIPVPREEREELDKDRELKCFAEIVKRVKKNLQIVTSLSGTPFGPRIIKDKPIDIKNLLDVKAKGLNLVKIEKGEYQLCKIEPIFRFCVLDTDCKTVTSAEEACTRSGDKKPEYDKNKMIIDAAAQTFQFITEDKTIDKKGVNFTVYLRSLQGMLYFAGELIRPIRPTDRHKKKIVLERKGEDECAGDKELPLFTVEKGEPGDAGVVVDHRNTTYWIRAEDNCSRSMQTLAFLSQILGLYQSRADIPVSVPQQTISR